MDIVSKARPWNPMKPIFLHTLDEFEVDHVDGDTVYLYINGKLRTRKLHRSTVYHNGKKVNYILVDGIRYFAA